MLMRRWTNALMCQLAAAGALGAGYALTAEQVPPRVEVSEEHAPVPRAETRQERRRREGWSPGYERAVGSASDEHAPPYVAPQEAQLPAVRTQVSPSSPAGARSPVNTCECAPVVYFDPCFTNRVVKPLRTPSRRCR